MDALHGAAGIALTSSPAMCVGLALMQQSALSFLGPLAHQLGHGCWTSQGPLHGVRWVQVQIISKTAMAFIAAPRHD